MTGLGQVVLQQPLFSGLEAPLGNLIAGCVRNVAFKEGHYLLHEGAPADEFYLIRQGAVALEIAAPAHPPAVFLTVGPGEIVGISWLTPPYRWTFDARAMEPVHALGIDAGCLRNKCEADHDLGYELMKRCLSALVQRLHATRLQMLDVYGSATT
jgi:CRP/FNR family transcriptional regulator, cyclic AMP receptor protein